MMTHSELIHLIDLTRLIKNDTQDAVCEFCHTALTPLGPVAAVCVYPEFVTTAKEILTTTNISVATVANFPTGQEPLLQVSNAIQKSLSDGADEIDVVLPYHALIHGDYDYITHFLTHCRSVTQSHVLKVIIESGALSREHIITATTLIAHCNADFVKTSTGKTDIGATPEACDAILSVLSTRLNPPGIKLSGGIQTPSQAQAYMTQIAGAMGKEWIQPKHVRIGASRLLEALR